MDFNLTPKSINTTLRATKIEHLQAAASPMAVDKGQAQKTAAAAAVLHTCG
jgi:6-phosphofructokinase